LQGYFVGPTFRPRRSVDVDRPDEIRPAVGVIRVRDLDEAIATVNASPLGNSASIYTPAARGGVPPPD
jgi:malonate-semialdehyde dehydrogenase (acetylating)/methylmalonate-semialdehyde dehydrogenase